MTDEERQKKNREGALRLRTALQLLLHEAGCGPDCRKSWAGIDKILAEQAGVSQEQAARCILVYCAKGLSAEDTRNKLYDDPQT